MTVDEMIIEGLAQDCASLEADQIEAVSEAATYRQMLLIALELWEADRRRANGATQRLRQLMGREPWHREEAPDYIAPDVDER